MALGASLFTGYSHETSNPFLRNALMTLRLPLMMLEMAPVLLPPMRILTNVCGMYLLDIPSRSMKRSISSKSADTSNDMSKSPNFSKHSLRA